MITPLTAALDAAGNPARRSFPPQYAPIYPLWAPLANASRALRLPRGGEILLHCFSGMPQGCG
jgi:hypothetical protein